MFAKYNILMAPDDVVLYLESILLKYMENAYIFIYFSELYPQI